MTSRLEKFEKKPTLLIVEDEDQILFLVGAALKREGFKVLSAECGAEGLRLFFENASAIDLLITDVLLPKIRGVELARRAREVRPDLMVLFMSGSFQIEPYVSGSALLAKPFSMPQIVEAVEALLNCAVPSA